MKRFFKWLLRLFKPNPDGYVRNIQEGNGGKSSARFSKAKTKVFEHPVLAWILTKDILSNEEDQQGTTIKLNLRSDARFIPIKLIESPVIRSRKQGLSRVKHEIGMRIGSQEQYETLMAQANKSKPISLLYRDQYGESFIYGKQIGLLLVTKEDNRLDFKGEEEDVFYRVTKECFDQLLPKEE